MPYWSTEIHTPLPVETVAERIRRIVRPKQGFLESVANAFESRPDEPPFEGEVSAHSFRVSRVIHYKNSFLPVIDGVIERGPMGTIVRVRMRMSVFTIAFMLFWFGFLAYALFKTWHPMTGAMFAFGVVLVTVCFYPEARKAENLLRRALS